MLLFFNFYSFKFIVLYILKLFNFVKVIKLWILWKSLYLVWCINILEYIYIKLVLNIEVGFELFVYIDRYYYYFW